MVISDVDSGLVAVEDIWVSCYKTDEPSVHGKVRLSLDEDDRSLIRLDAREGVEMTRTIKVRLFGSSACIKIADSYKD
jgi:proteasomal ATPase-associated factor 1